MPRILLAKLLRGGDDWRQGAWLLSLGVAAFMFAQFPPGILLFAWFNTMPMIWAAGALALAGAWYLPNRPYAWVPLKLVVGGAAVHWGFVLPLAYWIERWQLAAP